MSRRRKPVTGSGRVRLLPELVRQGLGRYTPAELAAFVDVVDPAGHRLLQVYRYFHEEDPAAVSWKPSTIGASTRFAWEVDPDDPDTWTELVFECKTCRDRGLPAVTAASVVEIREAVASAWDATAMTPRHTEHRTKPTC